MEFSVFRLGGGMRLCGYRWFTFLSLAALLNGSVWAAAVPAYNGKMNAQITDLATYKASKWGFAANDPRVGATIGAIQTTAGAVAATVAVGTTAAIGWPALLIGAGVSGLVSYGVGLGMDGLVKWLWAPDGTVQISGDALSSTTNVPPMPSSYVTVLDQYGVNGEFYFSQTTGKFRRLRTKEFLCPSEAVCTPPSPFNQTALNEGMTAYQAPNSTINYWNRAYTRNVVVAGSPTKVQQVWDYLPATTSPPISPAYQPAYKPVGDIIADLPDSYLPKPLSEKMAADAANALWKQASKNNPDILPWSPTDPITPADVSQWRAANPNAPVTTVGDFIAPAQPTPGTVPFPPPVGAPAPGTTAPVSAAPADAQKIDLGADPNTPAPTLEDTPTAEMILAPIFGLMPDLRSFTVPAQAGACPRVEFDALEKHWAMTTHCQLLEENRSTISTAMTLVFAIAAVLIVLRA